MTPCQTTDDIINFSSAENWHWPTPLLVRTFNGVDSLNSQLETEVVTLQSSLPLVGKRYDGALLEHDIFIKPSQSISILRQKIYDCLIEIDIFSGNNPTKSAKEINIDGWPLICTNGSFVPPHTHPNSTWSGVYYVSCEQVTKRRNGVLELIDPRDSVDFFVSPGRPFSRSIFIHPTPGMLVIFPSWLKHMVHPYFSVIPRISIPFNASLL